MRRRVAGVVVLAGLAAVTAAGRDKPFVAAASPNGPDSRYVTPKADGPVVVLIDEGVEPLFPLLTNDGGGYEGTVAREDRDVFSGVEAVRVTPVQKYRAHLPGWGFRVVQKPAADNEVRFVRFAWKKIGGTGTMIQFAAPNERYWEYRFLAGNNAIGHPATKSVADKAPAEWEVHTRDLFAEYGNLTLTGIALTPMDGTAGLFDHILLGRTVEDLDKATAAALGKDKPAGPLAGKERDALWTDLVGTDAPKAAAALRRFLQTAPDQVGFVRARLADPPHKAPDVAPKVIALIRDLDADPFDTREAATAELAKIAGPAVDLVRDAAARGPSDEVRYRCRLVLRKLGTDPNASGPPGPDARLSRAVRVLERAATPDARAALADIAGGKLAPGCAADAKAALARLTKAP
ncbi:MAG: hypothetical protein C0501_18190 [Isosphaera sp.]|nr:hypothetical protein [Isosphaera sp.]